MINQSAIKSIANDIMQANSSRNRMLRAMDDYYQGKWDLPSPLDKMSWVRKVVTTDPHDAVRAGTRVLSALNPNIKIHPFHNDEANKVKANEWEQQLKWHFTNASLRRRATILADIVMSALLYDMVAVQILYLPYQQKEEKAIKGDRAKSYEGWMRNGPFVITVHNPQNIYPIDSALGLEGVLSVKVVRAHEVISEWGDRANDLIGKIITGDGKKQMEWVTVYDYWDNDIRYVWGIPGETLVQSSPNTAGGVDILPPTEHGLGWIPWVVRQGGTTLFNQSEHRLNPMLYSVYQSGQWDLQNLSESLAISEIISYAAAPRGIISGPSKEGFEQDFGEPGNPAWEKPGHQYRPVESPRLDQNLFAVVDRIANAVDKSTIARILQNADIAPNTAFSTLNLATQTALGALKPYKHLAEVSVADILTIMLMWIKVGGEVVMGKGYDGKYADQQMIINPDEIDPNNIYLDVELQPDVPTDRLQRINAGRILQSMGVSVRRSLEEAGISDPEQAINEGYFDQMRAQKVALRLQKNQQAQQLEFEREAAMQQFELQMQQQEMMMAMQEQQQPEPGMIGPEEQYASGPPQTGPFGELNGSGFAPNEGGIPFAQGAPELTRETLNGENEVA